MGYICSLFLRRGQNQGLKVPIVLFFHSTIGWLVDGHTGDPISLLFFPQGKGHNMTNCL